MAVEAFVWFYKEGEPQELLVSQVLDAFQGAVASWEPEVGRLQLDFGSFADSCDIYIDPAAAQNGEARGLLISRPTQSPVLWEAILGLMSVHNSLLFFSDDTTPLMWDTAAVGHYPDDLICELGTPIQVRSAGEIISRRTGSPGDH